MKASVPIIILLVTTGWQKEQTLKTFSKSQVASLFERVPRRRGNRWPSEVDEKWEEEDVEGEGCWGYGAVSCVFKRVRLFCRPGLDLVFFPISSLFSVWPSGFLNPKVIFLFDCQFRRAQGELIYNAGRRFPDLLEPGSKCWGNCKVDRDGRCRWAKDTDKDKS